jgi:hypothetical protein
MLFKSSKMSKPTFTPTTIVDTTKAVQDITQTIMFFVLSKSVDTSSAMALIAKGMEIVERYPGLSSVQKKECLIAAIQTVAVGADGIAGTDDDLIPKRTVDALNLMLRENLVEQTVDAFIAISKGQFTIQHAEEVGKSCLGCFSKLLGRQ